jgi:hypothetical protein
MPKPKKTDTERPQMVVTGLEKEVMVLFGAAGARE